MAEEVTEGPTEPLSGGATEPAPESPAEPAPESPAEPAPESATEPAPESPAEPVAEGETQGTGRVVVGRYRLVRPLGRGGMGAVWQAHDTLLGRDVAVKEIWLPSATDAPIDPSDPRVRRALREAQAAARLRHPSIVTVHDVVTDNGRPWIVMELVDGRSLADEIAERGMLTEQRTAEIGVKVLDALSAAHRQGITHRDVKPSNILLDGDWVVLTDFGIAAIEDATALTATGHLIGSPAYMAPERINGQSATAAADLWALGVTLYATVTGRSPFQRDDTQATLAAVLTSKPTPPPYAGRLWPVMKGLLEKDPARRLTADQARPLLATAATSPGVTPRKSRWPRRGSTLIAPPPTLAAATVAQGNEREPITLVHQDPPRRPRRWWKVGALAAALLVAGALVAVAWPGPGNKNGKPDKSGREAAVADVKPAASTSKSSSAPAKPSPPVNQIVDSCLVGTWRMTSSQVENSEHTFRLAGGAGATMRVWPDGKTIQDYNKGAAQTATYGGSKYSYTLRGVYTSRTETRGGRAYFSDFSGGLTGKMVRNGRTQYQRKSVPTADDLPYICTEARVTFYGGRNNSTDIYARVSHKP